MLNLAQTLMFTDFRGVFQFADVESRYIVSLKTMEKTDNVCI